MKMTDTHKHKMSGPPPSTGLKVGFYGCRDQVVRVAYVIQEAGKRPPQHADVDCPACGSYHRVGNFMWRRAHSAEEFELSEVKLGVAGE